MNITELSGVGAKRAHALQIAGIFTVADLLEWFPRDYDDRSRVKTVAELVPEAVNTIRGVVAYEPECANLRRISLTKVKIKDHTGVLEILWFNQPFLKKNFRKGDEYIFTGKVGENGHVLQMLSPEYERVSETELSGGRIVPIYTAPKGFSQKMFRALVFRAIHVSSGALPRAAWASSSASAERPAPNPHELFEKSSTKTLTENRRKAAVLVEGVKGTCPLAGGGAEPRELNTFEENLPSEICEKYNLCDRETAIKNIHFPESDELFLKARRRLVFEELFFMQLALLEIKGAVKAQAGIFFSETGYAPFLSRLGFVPTAAQTKVLAEIAADFSGGARMNRLIQGDVGSGKTAVAFAAAYLAAKNGFQTALMAPTDVLATQHFEQCERLFAPLGFESVLLTGSLPAKTRRSALAKIADGSAAIIIGTHALIQDTVKYRRLGLCITDEQHRFGVNQRLALANKGKTEGDFFSEKNLPDPHILVMTATPIPRTLGLILYGDLDISVIDELPPGRQKIKTFFVNSSYRARIFEFIRKETAQNRQAYIICPAIEESGADLKTELQNVAEYTKNLSAALPEVKIAHLHGRLKSAEKQAAMDAFKRGEIQVIVSTTVIEVGVHVANASLIVVENAERFGLSQLHQLRGRVGRGTAESFCVLISDAKNEHTIERMKAMTETSDGFRLAEKDLEQRGAGDFFGTRQHGIPAFKIANLYRDLDILEDAQNAAREALHLTKSRSVYTYL